MATTTGTTANGTGGWCDMSGGNWPAVPSTGVVNQIRNPWLDKTVADAIDDVDKRHTLSILDVGIRVARLTDTIGEIHEMLTKLMAKP